MNFLSLLAIGLSLSMDTFSLALVLGIDNNKYFSYSLMVGTFHFIMPFIGFIIGNKLLNVFLFMNNYLLSFIYFLIILGMILELKNKENCMKLTIPRMLLYSWSVSIDSFSIGLVIKEITDKPFLAFFIFAILSFIFTYFGMMIGQKSYKNLGVISKILGLFTMVILLIINLANA